MKRTYKTKFTSNDLIDFAGISGDTNPIHLSEEYAKKTIFKQRVVHGVLLISMFSKIFGAVEGAIYLSQWAEFLLPAYIGDEITAKVTEEWKEGRRIGYITECFKGDTLIVNGGAEILMPK